MNASYMQHTMECDLILEEAKAVIKKRSAEYALEKSTDDTEKKLAQIKIDEAESELRNLTHRRKMLYENRLFLNKMDEERSKMMIASNKHLK